MPASEDTFDFIIVGGGTAGLVVASRLSEVSSASVLVIEAGSDQLANPAVNIPALWPSLLGTAVDWGFNSTKQSTLYGRTVGFAQGRLLGGSSGLNTQAFNAPSKIGIDAWKDLGNPGWDWESFSPYYRKCHTLALPSKDVSECLGLNYLLETQFRGIDGPIQASYSGQIGDPLSKAWVDSFRELSYELTDDPFSGGATGGFANATTVNAHTKERSYSASAYYAPVKDRPNLHLITDMQVTRVMFEQAPDGKMRATSVVGEHDQNAKFFQARVEVIVCTGAINSPKLLELSGIGNPSILQSHGIDLVVDNPGVGENFHDHPMTGISFEVNDNVKTLDRLNRQESEAIQSAMSEYKTSKSGPFSQAAVNSFSYLPVTEKPTRDYLLQMLDSKELNSSSMTTEVALLRKVISSSENSAIAFFMYHAQGNFGAESGELKDVANTAKGANYITIAGFPGYPLSRGSVHISSQRVTDHPTIETGFYQDPVDLEMFARLFSFIEKIVNTKPLGDLLKPGGKLCPEFAPIGKNLDSMKDYICRSTISAAHPCGTCSIKPKDKGGVVNERLVVHGTTNLRVVDASIIPIIVRGNLQSTVYAVAEKASDMIKEDNRFD